MRIPSVVFVAVLTVLGLSGVAHAAPVVACTQPADLCAGDPCTTGAMTVAPNCVLDFGDRRLVVAGAITVPDGGVLSLSAGDVDVRGPITGIGSTGPSITLHATRSITQLGSVRSVG